MQLSVRRLILLIGILSPSGLLAESRLAERKNEFIYDWSALGSGCRGMLLEDGGNVSLVLNPSKAPSLNRHELRFQFSALKLQSPVPKAEEGKINLEFARDCAVRVALNPPKGKRIRNVEVIGSFGLSKEKNSQMKVLAQTSLGMTPLASAQMEFGRDEAFAGMTREIQLTPHRSAGELAAVKCGQAKLFGMDLLFYVNRSGHDAKLDMGLDNKHMDVIVDLEDCNPNL